MKIKNINIIIKKSNNYNNNILASLFNIFFLMIFKENDIVDAKK